MKPLHKLALITAIVVTFFMVVALYVIVHILWIFVTFVALLIIDYACIRYLFKQQK